MSRSPVLTTRRTALAIAASAPFVLGSCDLDPRTSRNAPSPPEPAPDQDADVVASARSAILEVTAFLVAASQQHRGLRDEVASLLTMHEAHLAVLDDGSDPEEGDYPAFPPSGLPAARVQVRTRENTLYGTLVDAAQRADSGDLARALASMSAAVAQRVQL